MDINVSIIVPVYKVEEYLEKSIRSLTNQSMSKIEIIAVNDGSPDNCGEILARLAEEDPRIKVVTKENGGLSDARNAGLRFARGEYVAFLDSDDTADLRLYEELYKKAKEKNADMVASPIRYVWPDGKEKLISSGVWDTEKEDEIKLLFTRFYPAVWNKIYRRSTLEESGVLFKKGATFEDVEFSHRLFPYFRSVAATDGAAINYLQRENSITSKPDERLFDYLSNFESITAFFREKGLFFSWEKELEYAASRYLLATFLKRAGFLSDELFEKALERSLAFLETNFPCRKTNPYYLKNGAKGLYLKFFTPTLARLMRRK
ncbi:MAG: glycosyltransferase [Clostridia bacterium]|nr:glycosyltransferase [Clostridia bacterium]